MRHKFVFTACLLFFVVFSSAAYAADFSKESLLHAWEVHLKNDPETVRLDKQENGTYAFKTEAFPYDGSLKVLNVALKDLPEDYYSSYGAVFAQGVVEVALPDIPKDFRTNYGTSYYWWTEKNNMFYFDKGQAEWLTAEEYRARIQKLSQMEYVPPSCWGGFRAALWAGVLVVVLVLFVFVIRLGRKNYQGIRKGQDEAIAVMRESVENAKRGQDLIRQNNALLEKLIETLKEK